MKQPFPDDQSVMRRALELAARGAGNVEPNPQVGAVIVDEDLNLIAEGYHEEFGGPHAEVNAISAAGEHTAGKTMFVTLEPCSHHGKTPPCAQAVIDAGIARVVVATLDPSPHTSGKGVAAMREAGIDVEVGQMEEQAQELIAPFLKLLQSEMPYVHAKWAMTLDGKLAARTGHSQWISSPASREIVHQLRGRMDAILVGSGTVASDDPHLTARPAGPRTATRIVVDSQAALPLDSQLVQTANDFPVLLASTNQAPTEHIEILQTAGVEMLAYSADAKGHVPLIDLLKELGKRNFTNILVEGGGGLLGSFFDADLLDELHVFIAPKLVGGKNAVTPLGGMGLAAIPELATLISPQIEVVDGDVYVRGRVRRSE